MKSRPAWAVLAVALAACSGPSGPKPADVPRLDNPKPVRTLWSVNVGSAQRFTFQPTLAGDSVYAAARDGTVTRLDQKTGERRWRVGLDLRLSGGVGADEDTVAVASEEGEIVALEAADGKVRWRSRVSSEVLAPPAVGGGLVLVRSLDNRVFAFGANDGKRRWVYQRAPSSLLVRAPAGITIAGGLAFAGFPGGKLAALILDTGALRWEGTVALPKGSTELERVADVMGAPAVQGREVCAAAYRSRIACFDAASGRQLWGRELASLSGVSLDERYAYVADELGAVHAFDRSNGQSVWKQDKLAHRQLSTPLPGADSVAVGDLEGYVHFLARENGAFVARRGTGGGAVRAAPVPLGAGLLVQTEDGGVFALAL
ncbi:MAG TPA: outer membrane protein assembly factor BamB [Burkholderiales bacterium]|nr:outer membrane protein assembly factor BamB [Burkholderiales bacterium]